MLKNFFRNKIVYLGILSLFFSLCFINTPVSYLADDSSTYADRTQGFAGSASMKLQYLSYGVWKDVHTSTPNNWAVTSVNAGYIDQVPSGDYNMRYVFTFDSSVVMDCKNDISLTWIFIARVLPPEDVPAVDLNVYDIGNVTTRALNEDGNFQKISSVDASYQYSSGTSRLQLNLYPDFDFDYLEVSVYFAFPNSYNLGYSGSPTGSFDFGSYLGNTTFWSITDQYSLPDIGGPGVGDLPNIDNYVPSTSNPLIQVLRTVTDMPVIKNSLIVIGVLGVTAFVFFGKR